MAKKRSSNYGQEALEIVYSLSSKLKKVKEISDGFISINKYRLKINSSTVVTLLGFVGQKNTPLHIKASYALSASVTGEVKIYLNDQLVKIQPINGELDFSVLMSDSNVLKFTFSPSAEVYFTDLEMTLIGKLQRPNLEHDLVVFTTSGVDLYQLSTADETYRYNFSSIANMLSDYKNLSCLSQHSELFDHCCTYSLSDGVYVKDGDFILYGSTLVLKDMVSNTTYNSGITCSDIACIVPLFDGNKAVIYYMYENTLYYMVVSSTYTFGTPVAVDLTSKYEITKLVSLKSSNDEASYNPHFVFIDMNDDAYLVPCSSLGSYGIVHKLGKAEHVQAYADGSNITVFLTYKGAVTKLTGTISSLDGNQYFLLDTKASVLNAEVGFMDGNGNSYYKLNNCICEE